MRILTIREEIDLMHVPFKQFKERMQQITKYISMVDEQKEFVINIREHIGENEEFLNDYVNKMQELANSAVLYNAAIISLYGSFELYVDRVFLQYIDYIKRSVPECENLPISIKSKYIAKTSDFLSNESRFLNYDLTKEQAVEGIYEVLVKNQSNKMIDKLLLSHSGNMSSKQLNLLFQDMGITDAIAKLKKNRKLVAVSKNSDYEQEYLWPCESVFPVLDFIVRERNHVAHGWVIDNRVAYKQLLQKEIPFIIALAEAIKELLVSKVIESKVKENILKPYDEIIDIWYSGYVVGINNKDSFLKIDDSLYYYAGDDWYYDLKIVNLKRNGEDKNFILKKDIPVTIKSDQKLKKDYILYY